VRRITAIAALVAALVLGACGSGDESSSPPTAQGKATTKSTGTDATTTVTTTTAATTTTTAPTTTGRTPTAPKSATIPSSGAPDEGISGRPGGPGSGD
jgi:ABC-type glycerol-3-phosphate transport system substrate-binding protein